MNYAKRWEMPEVTFYEVVGHGFEAHEDRPLYAYGKPGETDNQGVPKTGELYDSLDRAMVSWVAEKYTGPRGAGGIGVGTAADWFMRMIGADQLVPADAEGGRALFDVLREDVDGFPPVGPAGLARRVEVGLEKRNLVLARMNNGKIVTGSH